MLKLFKNKKYTSLTIHEKTKLSMLPNPINKYPQIWSKIYYKEYPRFPRILLPISKAAKKDLFDTILRRKSKRKFTGEHISLEKLSMLLFFSAGINRVDERENTSRRVYPSGGARYPLEVYTIQLQEEENLIAGIYHYNLKYHSLELLQKGSFLNHLRVIVGRINEEIIKKSTAILVITAVFNRTEIKYGNRGYRFALFEAGHMAQNCYLVCTALDLGCCSIGGFLDDKINKLLDLDTEKEQALYLIAIGEP